MIKNNLIGKTFGRWTVIDFPDNNNKRKCWKCQCSCKNKTIKDVNESSLLRGISKSCGCISKEKMKISMKLYNKYDLSGDFGIGYTQKGEEFYFNIEKYNLIKDYCWHKNKRGYIITFVNRNGNKKFCIFFHRLIMDVVDEKGIGVDHINHVTSDNRTTNLRKCTASSNSMNSKMRMDNSTGYKGVYVDKERNCWASSITVNQHIIHLGRYDNLDDAIKSRKDAEIKYFGEYRYEDSKYK